MTFDQKRAGRDALSTIASTMLVAAGLAMASPEGRAATYYVDPLAGDNNSNGLVQNTSAGAGPWRSVARVNAWLAASAVPPQALQPGDTVLFKCGGVWDEALLVRRSGTSALPIQFGAYGNCATDARPVLRLSKPLTQWSTVDGVVWQVPVDTDVVQVTALQSQQPAVLPFARYPNVGTVPATSPDMLRVQTALTCASLGVTTTIAGDTEFYKKTCGLVHVADAVLSAHDLVGTEFIIRDGAFRFDRRRVLAHDPVAGRITWTPGSVTASTPRRQKAATYPMDTGFGFYLAGRAWMIDQSGEWAVETTTQANGTTARTLHLKPAGGGAPPADPAAEGAVRATALIPGLGPVGIDAAGQKFLTFSDLQVVDASTGVDLTATQGVTVSNLRIARSALLGLRGDGSTGLVLTGNQIEQSGFQGINAGNTTALTVTGNRVRDTGTHLPPNGEINWEERNYTAMDLPDADQASIQNNLIANSAYLGIFVSQRPLPGRSTTVSGNTLQNSCAYLDDCGALYTGGRNGQPSQLSFTGNLVLGASGSPIGRPTSGGATAPSSAQGIYLDDFARAVTVTGNVVADADQAVHAHLARENQINGNVFFFSRTSDIWFQEDKKGDTYKTATNQNVCADIYNCIRSNLVTDNLSVGLQGVPTYRLLSEVGDTTDFASFNTNVYANVFSGFMATEKQKVGMQSATLARNWMQWQNDRPTGLPSDPASSLLAVRMATAYTAEPVGPPETNQTSNGNFDTSTGGWTGSTSAGAYSLSYISDGYARFEASPSAVSALILNGLKVSAGKRYVLRFAMRTPGGEGTTIAAMLRNTGNFRPASTVFRFAPDGIWKTYFAFLQATANADGLPGNPGARLDIEIPAGMKVDVDDVRFAEVNPTFASVPELVHLFAGGRLLADGTLGPAQFDCPDAGTTLAARCWRYVNARDGLPVIWPVFLAANTVESSKVVIAVDERFQDSDGDGVADGDDRCAATPVYTTVDEHGCSYEQRRGH